MKAFYKRVTDGAPKDFPLTKPDTCTNCQRMQSDFPPPFPHAGFAIFGVEYFKVSGMWHQVSCSRKARNCSNWTLVASNVCS